MILLNGSNLKKSFDGETLFENVSFNVAERDKIGFIGVNGAGKSTLFKIITGEAEADEGDLYKNKLTKIGYLDQYTCTESSKTIMEEMLTAFTEVRSVERELEKIRREIDFASGAVEELAARQSELRDRYEELDGYRYKSLIRSSLLGLGFSETDFDRPVSELSGGQKTRVSLGRLLLSDANLLLLDEPTNHLDIESVEWLESFLQSYRGAFIIISHDRYFLDKVTNRTFEMDGGRLRTYVGSYSESRNQREVERKTEERGYENTRREIERLEGIVEQQRRWNREKNIKTAESKQKIIEKLEQTLTAPRRDPEDMHFSFKALVGGGNDVLTVENVSMSFGGEDIFKNADMHIVKGEKVFLLGANGCGKTTLIKNILGLCEPSGGNIRIGANIVIGYYDQIQENLDMDKTIFDELHDEYPKMTQTQIRNALAVFLFKGEDVFKEIRSLSGGERARVELAKLMLRPVNFLIMDEPTNHLDIESREALEKALADYDGTVLMVSHDRYFVNKLADRVVYMTADGLENYIGGYDDFTEAKKRRHTETAETVRKKPKNLDYREQKRQQAAARKILNRSKKAEEMIETLEREIADIGAEMANPEYSSDFTKLAELSALAEEKNARLDELMNEWEELQIQIEEGGADI